MKLYRQLTLQQSRVGGRYQIDCLLQQKMSQRDIAAFMGLIPPQLVENCEETPPYHAITNHTLLRS